MDKLSRAPEERFTDRVENYVKYRPTYPQELMNFIKDGLGAKPGLPVADVGSGTGIFTELLLKNQNTVFAVEPNEAMRTAAEKNLFSNPNFKSVNGTAEKTTLPSHSMNFVFAAQAFHWFRPEPTRAEFTRILKPGGLTGLIWNMRNPNFDEFSSEYERLFLTYGTDYSAVKAFGEKAEGALKGFFQTANLNTKSFRQVQEMNFEFTRGRMLSASYCPQPGHPNYDPMMNELAEVFARYAKNGVVSLVYDTQIYWG